MTGKGTAIRRRYRRAAIIVEADFFVLPIFTQRVRLGDLQESSFEDAMNAPLQSFDLPTFGSSPHDYPMDEYETITAFDVTMPPGIAGGTRGRTSEYYPARVELGKTPDLSAFRVRRGRSPYGVTAILVGRSVETKRFVFGLLAVVAGLVLSLTLYVLRSRREMGGAGLLVGAGAILVALLPLRAVLIPADVHELTLVDLLLGFLIVWLAALGIWSIPVPPLKQKSAAVGSKPPTEAAAVNRPVRRY
jgi:hypothetical protein